MFENLFIHIVGFMCVCGKPLWTVIKWRSKVCGLTNDRPFIFSNKKCVCECVVNRYRILCFFFFLSLSLFTLSLNSILFCKSLYTRTLYFLVSQCRTSKCKRFYVSSFYMYTHNNNTIQIMCVRNFHIFRSKIFLFFNIEILYIVFTIIYTTLKYSKFSLC